ncbi:MAG: GNAT family N-acetyltransferase [Chloroflexota bacterium]|nr:GNAT family N-acetyltransferase [Chloroflexota bacterium]
MQYKPVAGEQELATYREMVRMAFNISREHMDFSMSLSPLTEQNSRGLYDDEGRLLCGMLIIDNGALYFRGNNPIPTALISAVASPPEHRRKGYIRRMFEGMFNEQRELGVALTALYPFYFPFYRSFGYELAHDAAQYSVKFEQFRQWRKAAERGRFVPIDFEQIKADTNGREGGDLEKLNSIYTPWAQRNLGTVARTRTWWLHKLTHKDQPAPGYIYYDPDGRPAGYIIYHLDDKGDWVRDLVIHEMQALDRSAREAIYGFIYNHDSQAQKAVFWAPIDEAFASQIPDPREAEVKVHSGYMLRLLDVEGAFRQRAFAPEAEGAFTFSLTDEMLPANSGAYHVSVRDGRASVERMSDDAEAGVEVDARALAQLYGGYASPVRAASIGQIKVSRESDLAGMQAVLYPPGQPIPYMADDF